MNKNEKVTMQSMYPQQSCGMLPNEKANEEVEETQTYEVQFSDPTGVLLNIAVLIEADDEEQLNGIIESECQYFTDNFKIYWTENITGSFS